MLIYKIINDHAAPNLKQSFRLYSEGDTMHDLRNHATDLVLPKPKRKFGERSFKYNRAIHRNSLPNKAKNANSISTFKRIGHNHNDVIGNKCAKNPGLSS